MADEPKYVTEEEAAKIWADYDALSAEEKAKLAQQRFTYSDGELEIVYQPSDDDLPEAGGAEPSD